MPYKDATPIDMTVQGKRIYCNDLTAEQQKWMIDQLGSRIGIVLDGKTVAVKVKSVKQAKAILEVL